MNKSWPQKNGYWEFWSSHPHPYKYKNYVSALLIRFLCTCASKQAIHLKQVNLIVLIYQGRVAALKFSGNIARE